MVADLGVMREHRLKALDPREQRRDRQPPALDLPHHRFLRVARHFARRAPAMRPEPQRPRGGDARVLLPQRARRGVARIGEQFSARFLLRRVEREKVGARHIDLAAHLEDLGRIALKRLRNITDMRDIGGDILAHLPVAPHRRAHQHALLIAQRAGQAVDLVLGGDRHRLVLAQRQEPPHPRQPFAYLFGGESVVEAHHPHRMGDLGQRRGRDRMPDLARGRIRAHQLRKRRLQLGIAPHQRVIFLIADLGRILGVIQPVVLRDGARQPHQLIGGLGFCDVRAHTPSSNRSACARASGVTSAPLSIRAISSWRPASSSRATLVRVTVPSELLAIM